MQHIIDKYKEQMSDNDYLKMSNYMKEIFNKN